tara:strand:+ start:159081 stop:161510 length:2430 start_codon:yes stop_codon:yes gene_type:complete
MNKYWSVLLAGLLTQPIQQVCAFETFIVEDIRIEGLQRITEGTVINYLPITEGEALTENRTSEILKALFQTGFFQDIGLSRENNILIIDVVERPTIGKITISGNDDIPTDNLTSTLKETGLAEGHVFDRSTLEMVRNELERMYFGHGKYSVSVETVVVEKDRNRVDLEINIIEGQAARIKAINLIGNRHFTNKELLKEFSLAESHCFSFVSRDDQYDKEKLSADLEKLRTFYLDRGYLNFQMTSTQVTITPDKLDIYITINIEEGAPFKVGQVLVAGDVPIPESEIYKLITIEPGETFNRTQIADIVENITERLGQEGFANANVNPVPDLHDESNTADVTFYIEPGSRMYVRRILFEGNAKTRDEVLRRELVQMESAQVDTSLIEGSRTRLNRTGYFKEVKVDLKPVPGVSDQVDILYTVEEASAGQLGGGVGFSDVDGLVFNANVSNRNFMGSGNSVDFSFNHSKAYTTYNMGYNNPYYTINGVSRGFSLFYSKTDLSRSTSISDYTTDAAGANMSYSFPTSPVDRISFGYGVQSTKLSMNNEQLAPLEIQRFIFPTYIDMNNVIMPGMDQGHKSDEVTMAFGWTRNTFDRYLFPENGMRQSASLSLSVPGSHLQYYRLTYDMAYYKKLYKDFIFTTTGLAGYGDGFGKTKELPFYRNFFAGGTGTVRGYDDNSLGPKDTSGNPFGGNLLVAGSTGIILPNSLFGNIQSIRAQIFFDIGQVYDLSNKKDLNDMAKSRNPHGIKYSVGASLTWMSPLAPLVFSYSFPLNAVKPVDITGNETTAELLDKTAINRKSNKRKEFSFTFGTVF